MKHFIKIDLDTIYKKDYLGILYYDYKYEETEVKCNECGEKFLHTELKKGEYIKDCREDFSYEICPECGKINCCDIEYETISHALKRLQK